MMRFSPVCRFVSVVLWAAVLAVASVPVWAVGGGAETAGVDLSGFDPKRVVSVGDVDALQAAMRDAEPGDLIEVAEGTYRTQGRLTIDRSGEAETPIVIRARHRGRARIVGAAGFRIHDAAHVAIEGFTIETDDAQQALLVDGSHHTRFTRNVVRIRETPEKKRGGRSLAWITINGDPSHHNRVDHNLIEEKRNSGQMVLITGTALTDGKLTEGMASSKHDRIDHNHFRNFHRGQGNGYDTIVIGWSGLSHDASHTLIDNNRFDNCSGEAEIISIKTRDAVVRDNTFVDCEGYLTLRNTHDCLVEGNFFFNPSGKEGVSGVWVIGEGHRVVNNYFEGLDRGIRLDTGDIPRRTRSRFAYEAADAFDQWGHMQQVRGALIAFNTFANCETALWLAHPVWPEKYPQWATHPPADCTVARNVFWRERAGESLDVGGELIDWTWTENVFFTDGGEVEAPEGAGRVADPRLRRSAAGFLKLTRQSPCLEVPEGGFEQVAEDIEGQPREGTKHIGCDQWSEAPIAHAPLTGEDVGPNAP